MQTGNEPASLAEDMIDGAGPIAQFVFGAASDRRKVYHLIERHNFPAFKIGGKLYARKSSIKQWISEKEMAFASSKLQ